MCFITSLSFLGSVMLLHPHSFLLSWLFSPNTAQKRPLTFRAVFWLTVQVIGILESPRDLLKKLLQALPPNDLNWIFIFLCSILLHGPYTWMEYQAFHLVSLFPFCSLNTKQCFLWRNGTHTHTHTHPALNRLPESVQGPGLEDLLFFLGMITQPRSRLLLCNHRLKDQRSFFFPILHIHVGNLLFLPNVNTHW